MNIAINPSVPDYRASIKLTAIETEDMKIRTTYKSAPLMTGGLVLVLWGLFVLGGVIAGTI